MTMSPSAYTVALFSHQKSSGVAACSRPTATPHSMGARLAGCDAVAPCALIARRATVSMRWVGASGVRHPHVVAVRVDDAKVDETPRSLTERLHHATTSTRHVLERRVGILHFEHDLDARAAHAGQPRLGEARLVGGDRQLRDAPEPEDRLAALEARVVGFAADEAEAERRLVEPDRRIQVVDEEFKAEPHGGHRRRSRRRTWTPPSVASRFAER